MSGSLNRVQLIGNLGGDPEVRSLGSGGRVVTMSVATSEGWTDKATGERRERTEWHRVVVWNEGLGLVAEKYLAKGSRVFVEGQLRTRSYEDAEGITRYSTEVHLTPYNGTLTFLDGKRDGGERGREEEQPARQRRTSGRSDRKAPETAGAGGSGPDDTDGIPF